MCCVRPCRRVRALVEWSASGEEGVSGSGLRHLCVSQGRASALELLRWEQPAEGTGGVWEHLQSAAPECLPSRAVPAPFPVSGHEVSPRRGLFSLPGVGGQKGSPVGPVARGQPDGVSGLGAVLSFDL